MINRPCHETRRFACFDGSAWTLSTISDEFTSGATACGVNRTFSVPWNGWESSRLAAVAAGESVWIDYRQQGGDWVPAA